MKLYNLLPALRMLCGSALFFFSLAIPVSAENMLDLDRLADGGQYVCTYEEHYYDGVGESVFTLQKIPSGYLAVWEGINDTTEVFADAQMRTQKIMVTDNDTSLTVERQGQQLLVRGMDGGESIDKELKLTSPHWFQLLPLSLISFTTSDREKAKFSMFDPYNLKVRDMQVEKQGIETISMFGKEYTTVKLNMRLRGILTPFWKSEMWNAVDSGIYIKYEGLNVIPKFHKSKIYLKKVEFRPH
ncbi:MAG: hypothetical protein K9L66_06600 [Spirochaetaceae bacterium]|nr:hypothetical protein [Spirochaetaceae bacterium]